MGRKGYKTEPLPFKAFVWPGDKSAGTRILQSQRLNSALTRGSLTTHANGVTPRQEVQSCCSALTNATKAKASRDGENYLFIYDMTLLKCWVQSCYTKKPPNISQLSCYFLWLTSLKHSHLDCGEVQAQMYFFFFFFASTGCIKELHGRMCTHKGRIHHRSPNIFTCLLQAVTSFCGHTWKVSWSVY